MSPVAEKRYFIRHPICFPLEFQLIPKNIQGRSQLFNISEGGLLFSSKYFARTGEVILLQLPIQNILHKIKAVVKHVQKNKENPGFYNIGVSFCEHSDAFKVKLVEQMHAIDGYRSSRSLQLGREISIAEASEDWVKNYADKFDKLFWGKDNQPT
jgi:hypothetical protein